jgi:hypothetical protein
LKELRVIEARASALHPPEIAQRARQQAARLQGFFEMELAGLEPATSWVRCSSLCADNRRKRV